MCLTDTGINDSMEQAQCLTDSNGALAKSRHQLSLQPILT